MASEAFREVQEYYLLVLSDATLSKICLRFKCAAVLSESMCTCVRKKASLCVLTLYSGERKRLPLLHQTGFSNMHHLTEEGQKKIHQQKYTQVAIILCPQHLCCAISKLSLSGATTTPFNSQAGFCSCFF